jgi:hypothetical protein
MGLYADDDDDDVPPRSAYCRATTLIQVDVLVWICILYPGGSNRRLQNVISRHDANIVSEIHVGGCRVDTTIMTTILDNVVSAAASAVGATSIVTSELNSEAHQVRDTSCKSQGTRNIDKT